MAEIYRIAAKAAADAAAAAVQTLMNNQAAAAAATPADTQPVQRKRPELPTLDAKNIDIWIRRVEVAYCRAAVTTPTDKFAFLESQFEVSKIGVKKE